MSALPTLTLNVTPESADALADALSEAGALAVTLRDAGIGEDERPVYEPGVGEMPLWPSTQLEALFIDQAALDAAWRVLDPEQRDEARAGTLEQREWTRAWLDRFAPQRFGERLWICPRELEPPPESKGGVLLRLDPGLAFGTGDHPTTALCLEWLDAAPPAAGADVIDYGCGSGVLAIAALALGAGDALAVDHDAQALAATRANAASNGVGAQVRACLPDAVPADARCDLLLANILAQPLIDLAPTFATLGRPGAILVLSGILDWQADAVAAAYRDAFELVPPASSDGWVRLVGVRRA